ncbi:hypothetical protein BGZ95_002367 [Linnemannia exigua]|uniref:Uncharacterized protein n=1 Tax=Linnemannia exigua TaxID=604196 RepID=A0AAD4HBM5_9FUNG|nr:hypothetical protein BGZ95_002367 [Linnemannia exigua]
MEMNDHQQDQDDIDYEVGQEQLDAVDRMLEELDMDEQFDRVPAAFRIVERFEQQHEQQRLFAQLNSSSNINGRHIGSNTDTFPGMNGYHHDNGNTSGQHSSSSSMHRDQDMEEEGYTLQGSETEGIDRDDEEHDSDDEAMGEPFGYIPLDQGDFNGNGDDDEDEEAEDEESNNNTGYTQMQSDDDYSDAEGVEQGYDGYLRRRNRDGTVPVPVIPAAVQIDLDNLNNDLGDGDGNDSDDRSGTARAEAAAELIPDEDLKTIAMVMSSFSLPAPDWAQSIPEDRWLPRIVQRAGADTGAAAEAAVVATSSGIDTAIASTNATSTVLATATTAAGTTAATAANTSSLDL